MKDKFLHNFFSTLTNTTKDIGGLFTFDFYLSRGRNHNLFYPGEEQKFKKGFYNLKQQGYIKLNDKKSFKFTKRGKGWYQKNIYKYTPFREKIWDKKWRVVFFDIPEEAHTRRDIFRYRLKNMGFYQLQKSILVIPFKCDSDVADICNRLKIDQYVDILVAESLGAKEEELKKIFNL